MRAETVRQAPVLRVSCACLARTTRCARKPADRDRVEPDYAYAYKMLKIGPLVGMPVPGTCTFAGWEMLQDGLRWGVPGLGVKDSTTGKYLENLQTEPDVRVMNDPAVVVKGQDQQLEAAVAELKKRVK